MKFCRHNKLIDANRCCKFGNVILKTNINRLIVCIAAIRYIPAI